MKSERIEYLDLLKGICIVLVVFCHYPVLANESVIGNIFMLLAWATVPNFFMVTGGLLHNTNKNFSWKKHLKKIARMYVVLVIWKVIYLLFFIKMQTISFSKAELVNYLFLMGDIDGVRTGIMWFMYAYLMLLLFYPISGQLFHNGKEGKNILFFTIVVSFCGSMGIKIFDFIGNILLKTDFSNSHFQNLKQIFPYGQYMNVLFYFLLGAFLLQWRDKINAMLRKSFLTKIIPAGLVIIGTVGLLFVKKIETGSFCWSGIYLQDGYNRFFTVVMSVGFYLIFMHLNVKKVGGVIAKYVGKETMGIYYIHFLLAYFFTEKIVYKIGIPYSFLFNCVRALVITMICVGIVQIMKRIPLLKRIV